MLLLFIVFVAALAGHTSSCQQCSRIENNQGEEEPLVRPTVDFMFYSAPAHLRVMILAEVRANTGFEISTTAGNNAFRSAMHQTNDNLFLRELTPCDLKAGDPGRLIPEGWMCEPTQDDPCMLECSTSSNNIFTGPPLEGCERREDEVLNTLHLDCMWRVKSHRSLPFKASTPLTPDIPTPMVEEVLGMHLLINLTTMASSHYVDVMMPALTLSVEPDCSLNGEVFLQHSPLQMIPSDPEEYSLVGKYTYDITHVEKKTETITGVKFRVTNWMGSNYKDYPKFAVMLGLSQLVSFYPQIDVVCTYKGGSSTLAQRELTINTATGNPKDTFRSGEPFIVSLPMSEHALTIVKSKVHMNVFNIVTYQQMDLINNGQVVNPLTEWAEDPSVGMAMEVVVAVKLPPSAYKVEVEMTYTTADTQSAKFHPQEASEQSVMLSAILRIEGESEKQDSHQLDASNARNLASTNTTTSSSGRDSTSLPNVVDSLVSHNPIGPTRHNTSATTTAHNTSTDPGVNLKLVLLIATLLAVVVVCVLGFVGVWKCQHSKSDHVRQLYMEQTQSKKPTETAAV